MILDAPLAYDSDLAYQIQKDILKEIYRAAKFPNIRLLRDLFKPMFAKPTRRFSEFIAVLDGMIKDKGFVYTAKQAIRCLANEVSASGQEKIPDTGPVIIASNHPGTYDGFAIISQLPRNDIKLVVSGIPFFRNLPTASNYLIYSTQDTYVRMNTIRQSIRHLADGGLLIIFPSGRIDPDPSILPAAGESFNKWSRSVDVFLKKVPESRLVLTITSGVLTGDYIHHPFTKFFKNDHERRRIMEFMQVIKQMVLGKPVELNPKVTFSEPMSIYEISNGNAGVLGESVIKSRALQLLNHHMDMYYPYSQERY